ncbi:MAG: ATP phosphoribosyltransferase regulatory subunit, partial [Caldilineaceae bacterium]
MSAQAPAPIPQGVADHFWAQARARRTLEARLLALFRSWGYGDVLPPAFEYAETLDARANPELQSEIYRFVDRDGRM